MKKVVHHIVFVSFLLGFHVIFSGGQPALADDPRNWQFKQPMPTARTGVTAVELNGLIYVMGGLDAQGSVLNVVEKYDPIANTWQTAPKLRTARFNAAAVVYDDTIFLMGGQDSLGNALKKVEVFKPDENDWDSFDNLNEEREGLAAVILNDELYVMGGSNGNANILDSVEYLDTDEEKWENSSDWTLDVPRALFAYVTIDEFAYSIGGFSSFGPMGLVQQYHEENGTQDLSQLVPGRGGLSAVVLDNSIYALGGRRSNNEVVNAVDRFFPEENRWEQAPAMQTERERFAAISIDDKIFVFGGNRNNGDVLNSVEVFTTSVAPNALDDVLITDEDTEMSINVLINDEDPSGESLIVSSFSQPQNGSVTQLNTATFNYLPDPNFFGEDAFTYTALNESGGTALARVNITVSPVNDPPAFSSIPTTGAAQNTLYSYIISAVDVDGDALSFNGVTIPDWLVLTDLENGQALLEGMPGGDQLGDHDLVISTTDGFEVVEQRFTITVVEGVPGDNVLLSPADGAVDVATTVSLSWSVAGASSYDLQVARDTSFNSLVVDESGLTTNTFELQGLASNTTYFWRILGSNEAGSNTWSDPFSFRTVNKTSIEDELPVRSVVLHANFPNPFREATTIDFELTTPSASRVHLAVYDLRGREIITLKAGSFSPGRYAVKWDGTDASGRLVASGTYLVRLQQDAFQFTRPIMLIR